MYVKLFSSLYQGTLRGRSDEILVFTNLLAYADQYGHVDKHFKAISDETGLPLDRVMAAITELEKPDPESRSPEMNGCRIIRLDEHRVWGWKIVNYGKYRSIRSEEDRREQNRLAQGRWREKRKQEVSKVSKVSHGKPQSAQAEAEADTEETKEPASQNARLVNSQDSSKVIQTLPLRDGSGFDVRQSFVAELEPLYPSVDVAATIGEMKGWLIGNPHKRKTRRGIKAFIVRWLQNTQEAANGV